MNEGGKDLSFIFVEVVTTSRKTPHLVFLAFSSAEAINST